MLSMTGFGSASSSSGGVSLQIQIRTVNSRFLEVRSHLPKEYLAEEGTLRAVLEEYFQRGHVDLFIQRKVPHTQLGGTVEVHTRLLKSYLKQLKKTAQEVGVSTEGVLSGVSNVPHLVSVEVKHRVGSQEKAELIKALRRASEQCLAQRRKEGSRLRRDLQQQLRDLVKLASSMERVRKASTQQLKKLRQKKFEDLKKRLDFDQAKLLMELMNLDKLEIAEEIVRLRAHVEECQALLSSSQPVGKRLDFFAQELLREVNTVGSKSQDSQLTKLVVEAKTVIEKLREQVQNIE